jgi:hypothetical protein
LKGKEAPELKEVNWLEWNKVENANYKRGVIVKLSTIYRLVSSLVEIHSTQCDDE